VNTGLGRYSAEEFMLHNAYMAFVLLSMLVCFYDIWAKGPFVPRARGEVLFKAIDDCERAELVRLATGNQSTSVPHLARLPADERLILSMPVFLYESRSSPCLYPAANRAARKLRWPQNASSGKEITISLVDCGTLRLTQRRFIFTSTRRHREFPLAELTHVSTARTSIALASLGRFGISYFRGIGASRMMFPVFVPVEDKIQTHRWSRRLTGKDVKKIISLIQSPSTLPST
jgi:hypothetical protein